MNLVYEYFFFCLFLFLHVQRWFSYATLPSTAYPEVPWSILLGLWLAGLGASFVYATLSSQRVVWSLGMLSEASSLLWLRRSRMCSSWLSEELFHRRRCSTRMNSSSWLSLSSRLHLRGNWDCWSHRKLLAQRWRALSCESSVKWRTSLNSKRISLWSRVTYQCLHCRDSPRLISRSIVLFHPRFTKLQRNF